MEVSYVLIWVLLVYICQNSLSCIGKICALDFLIIPLQRKLWLSMESSVRVSDLLIKWDDICKMLNTVSECQATVLIILQLLLFYISVTIFSSCLYCSSMYSFLVNIVLLLRTVECVRFGDSFVEMRWKWRCWNS